MMIDDPSMAVLLWFGFLLGVRHACDADHVVAVTSILDRTRGLGAALRVGALWGLGHTVTLIGVGVAMILFGVTMPESAATVTDLVVAAMLVVLGLNALRRKASSRVEAASRRPRGLLRAVAIGVIHGLAGSGALVLLTMSEIRSRVGALGYLALFGAGTVLGMMAITTILALPFVYGSGRLDAVRTTLMRGAAALGIFLGVVIAYRAIP
jgi:nickel/cobalt transporter (NicO) family protein